MDFSAYGDAQAHQQTHHHQQYAADPTQAYQHSDYYYQQYSAHQPYLHHHQNATTPAAAAAYYYPQDYNTGAVGGAAAAGGVDGQPMAPAYPQQPHPEPNIHPPGIDLSSLAQVAAAAAAAAANQQSGYFPQAVMEQQPHGNPMPPFSHLMAGPAEPGRMMPGFRENQWGGKRGGFGPPRGVSRGGRPPFRGGGGGRRGGGNFARGGGRGNFNHHMPRVDNVPPPPGRGRGRMGRGSGRRPPAPSGMPPQLVGCAVCKIDCNSLEILEQHRQGKRHQRNVQRLEEERKRRKPSNVSDTKPANQNENIVVSQDNEASEYEKLTASSPVSENNAGAEQEPTNAEQITENVEKQAENTEELQQQQRYFKPGFMGRGGLRRPRPGGYEDRRLGLKKRQKGKLQFDPRKGKRVKMASAPLPPADQQLPKICALCNITCDSQAVLDCHLAGKRHAAKVKRFQSQQQLYGPQVLQALFISQAQQAISLAQQQAVFNPQDQQAVLEALLGQAIQQVLAGQQAVAGTQDQSGPSGTATTLGATSELHDQEPAAGTEEQVASESENESEGDEKEQEDDAQDEEGDGEDPEGDVQEEGDGRGQDGVGVSTEDATPLAEFALPPSEDSAPAPEFGASATEHAVPGLEIEPEEAPVSETSAAED